MAATEAMELHNKEGVKVRTESQVFDFLRKFNRALAPLVVRIGFLQDISIMVKEGGTRLQIRPFSLDWFVLKEIFERNIYAADIRPGDTVIDIGAHIGLFSIYASLKGAHVLAFEPDQRNLEIFRRNLSVNGFSKEITVTPKAVWTHSGFKEMYFARNNGNNSFYHFGYWLRKSKVSCVALTDILNSIDGRIQVLKIDIEGSEYDILENADLSKVEQICLEYHTHAGLGSRLPSLMKRLKDQGFNVKILGKYALNGYLFASR